MHILQTIQRDIGPEKGEHKLIFWRRVARVLKDLKFANKDMFDHIIGVINPINDATRSEICFTGL